MNHLQPKETKKSESKESTKKKLLASGLIVFAKYGFDGSTTKTISLESGVNEALINRYFGGKEGLFEAIIADYYQGISRKGNVYTHGKTLQEELINFLEATLSDYGQNPTFLKAILPRTLHQPSIKKIIRDNLVIPNPRLMEGLSTFFKSKVIHPSHDMNEISELLLFFISGVIYDKIGMGISSVPVEKSIQNFARMLSRDLMGARDSDPH